MKLSNPFQILSPNERWAPSQSQMEAMQNAYEKLLPPLVYKIRLAVEKWRNDNYNGASETSKSLLNFWFNQEHLIGQNKFQFFFSQREAIELTENWYDWIDYWAIDFNYEDKKEIIKLSKPGLSGLKDEQDKKNHSNPEIKKIIVQTEFWTGNYIFENEWQSFRTKKTPNLEFTSIPHEYKNPGKYKVMVKVVDILGIDTSKIIEVKI